MTDEKIFEQIKQLKQDAKQKGVYSLAIDIARTLGTSSPKKYGSYWDYTDDEMAINYDDYGNNISINYRGVYVYSAQLGETRQYRPDIPDWINKLHFLYDTKVIPINQARKIREDNAEAIELYETWGIKLTSCAQKGEKEKS